MLTGSRGDQHLSPLVDHVVAHLALDADIGDQAVPVVGVGAGVLSRAGSPLGLPSDTSTRTMKSMRLSVGIMYAFSLLLVICDSI